VSEKRVMVNKIIVFVVSAIFLFGMFIAFIALKVISVGNMFRYPATMNCDSISNMFNGNSTLFF
jgi:hypothetical protein